MSRIAPWQVWRAALDPTEGVEQAGHRPVVVASSPFHLRVTASALLLTLPLTTRERVGWLHHVPVVVNGQRSYVMTEQPRTIARSRLIDDQPLCRLSAEEIAAIREALAEMLDL